MHPRTTDTRLNYLRPKFKSQSQKNIWDVDRKAEFFCRNNSWTMKNMDMGLVVPEWVLIVWPKMSKKFVCPSPKVLDFNEKASLGVCSPLVSWTSPVIRIWWVQLHTLTNLAKFQIHIPLVVYIEFSLLQNLTIFPLKKSTKHNLWWPLYCECQLLSIDTLNKLSIFGLHTWHSTGCTNANLYTSFCSDG